VVHWNGAGWTSMTSGTTSDLFAVWADTTTDAWAVGTSGAIVHWNGTAWAAVPSGVTNYLYGVWGSGPSDVWAVGETGTTLHTTAPRGRPRAVG